MKSDAKIEFDPVAHAYRLNGRPVPSVTQVISDIVGTGYNFISREDREWYLQRGTVVHHCAKLIADGTPFEADPRIAGRLDAIRRWYADHKPFIISTEVIAGNVPFQFAGTADLLCKIGTRNAIVDWKGSIDLPRLALQLGGYSILNPGYDLGIGVEVRDDGTYRATTPIILAPWRNKFLALRQAYSLRREFEQKENEEQTHEQD